MLDDALDATPVPGPAAAAGHLAAVEARRAAVERHKRRRRILVDSVLGLLALLLAVTALAAGRIALAGDPLAAWNRLREPARTVTRAPPIEFPVAPVAKRIDENGLTNDAAKATSWKLVERVELLEQRAQREPMEVQLSFARGTLADDQLGPVALVEVEGWLHDRHGEATRMVDRSDRALFGASLGADAASGVFVLSTLAPK